MSGWTLVSEQDAPEASAKGASNGGWEVIQEQSPEELRTEAHQQSSATIDSVTRPQSPVPAAPSSASLSLGVTPAKPRSIAEGLTTEQQERRGGMPLVLAPGPPLSDRPENYHSLPTGSIIRGTPGTEQRFKEGLARQQQEDELHPLGPDELHIAPVGLPNQALAPPAQAKVNVQEPSTVPVPVGSKFTNPGKATPQEAAADIENLKSITGVRGYGEIARNFNKLVPTSTQPAPTTKESEIAATGLLKGATTAATPLMIATALTAPEIALLAAGGAEIGGAGVKKLAQIVHASPETQDLVEQAGQIAGGFAGGAAYGGLRHLANPESALTDLLWKRGYIRDKSGDPISFGSETEARATAQEILRQNPGGIIESAQRKGGAMRAAGELPAVSPAEAARRASQTAQADDLSRRASAHADDVVAKFFAPKTLGGQADTPASEPAPAAPQPSGPVSAAANSMAQAEANASQARMRAAGVPPPPPPAPPQIADQPGAPPELKQGHIPQKLVDSFAGIVSVLPENLRAQAIQEAHGTLARVILEGSQKGPMVGPDGKLIAPVKDIEGASKVAIGLINDAIGAHDKVAAAAEKEAAKGAGAVSGEATRSSITKTRAALKKAGEFEVVGEESKGVESENGIRTEQPSTAASAEPGVDVSNEAGNRRRVETPDSGGASGSHGNQPAPISNHSVSQADFQVIGEEPRPQKFQKGEQVLLSDGRKGTVDWIGTNPQGKDIARVRDEKGQKTSVEASTLKSPTSEPSQAKTPAVAEGNAPQHILWSRHGETELDVDATNETVAGWTPEPLDERGIASAKKLAGEVKEHKPTVIISSDLERAKQTADIVGKELGIPVKTDARLRPQHVPETEGLKVAAAKPIWQDFEDNPDKKPEGGESWKEFENRQAGAIKDIHDLIAKGERPMVVTHSRNLESAIGERPEPGEFVKREVEKPFRTRPSEYGPPKRDFEGKVPLENLGFNPNPAEDFGNQARAEVERRMGGALPRGASERRTLASKTEEGVVAKPEGGASPAPVKAETPPAGVQATGETPKYKFGNTQAPIHPDSEAAKALESARARISDSDLMGKGRDIGDGGNHVTVRYGIQGEDTAGIKKFLSQQAPFEASLGKTEKFPPSEHSDGAAVIQAPIEAPELHRLNAELEKHGDFTEPSFKQFRPHATIAYVDPAKADRYTGMSVTAGKKFTVDRVAITDRNGHAEIVKLEGKKAVERPAGSAPVPPKGKFSEKDLEPAKSVAPESSKPVVSPKRLAVPYKLETAFDTGERDTHYDRSGPAEIWRVRTDSGDLDVFVKPGGGFAEAMKEGATILGQNAAAGVNMENVFNKGTYKATPEALTKEAEFATKHNALKSKPSPKTEAPRREVISTGKKELAAGKRIAGTDGDDTKLLTNDGERAAKYRVVEAADLVPSHNAQTFAKNASYPAGVQERAYDTSKEAQNRVIQQSQHFNPDYLINSNPDAVNGPPVITPDGTVLGGNSRTMTVQRVYQNKNFVAYKHVLIREAEKFRLDKEAVRKMDEPILVREVAAPKTQDEMRALGSALNKSMTGLLGVSERAVSAGKAISRDTLGNIAGMLDGIGKDASLRDLLRERGKDVLAALVKDGAITERERPQFVDTATGGLSEEGKTFVERALLGSVVDDPRLMDSTPKSVLNKLDGSLAALSNLAPRTDAYNILPLLREALREHGEIAQRGISVEDHLNQTGLFSSERDPAVDALTRLLAEKSLAVRERMRRFAEDANFDVQGQGTLGLIEQPSPAKAFNDAFGSNLTDEDLENSILKAAQSEPTIQSNGGETQAVRPTEAGAGSVQHSEAGEPRPSGEGGIGSSETSRTKTELKSDRSGERVVPGARSATTGNETGTTSIQDLTDSIKHQIPEKTPLKERLRKAADIGEKVGGAKDAVTDALNRLKGSMAALWDAYNRPPQWGDYEDATGKWSGADQTNALDLQRFTTAIKKAVPSKLRREAISNWIEAAGDKGILQKRAEASSDKWKPGYEAALNLSDEEETIARNIMNRNDATLEEAQNAGILQQGVENYVRHVYADNPKAQAKIQAELNFASLQTKPGFTKERKIPTYFDAEQMGFVPKDKDVGYLTAIHERSFREALAARAYIKSLMKGKAEDERPLVMTSWASAHVIPGEEGIRAAAYLIKPNIKRGDEAGDYMRIDHPALRGWKWAGSAGTTPVDKTVELDNGEEFTSSVDEKNSIFVQGDALVHPAIYQKLKNNLTKSAIRAYAVDIAGHNVRPGEFALNASAEIKHAILSFSGFHQTTLGLHSLEHRTLPAGMPELDLNQPDQKAAIEHGLMIAAYDAEEQFGEGVASGGLVTKLPGVGPLYHTYTQYLFNSYLPRVKMAVYLNALERNRERYKDELTDDQIHAITAEQTNASFGGLNYRMLGRSKTLQDVLRLGLMAPDFFEARSRYVGQAGKPYGREQLVALVGGALALYTIARMLNMITDRDPHWDKPFSVVYRGKEYGMRTVQEDLFRFVTGPGQFLMGRLSPIVSAGIHLGEGRNRFGRHETFLEWLKDVGSSEVPIPAQPWTRPSKDSNAMKAVETIAKMVGVNIKNAEDKFSRQAIISELRKGNDKPLHEAVREKKVTLQEAMELRHRAGLSPLQDKARHEKYGDLLRQFNAASDADKKELLPILREKRLHLLMRGQVEPAPESAVQ